MLSGSAVYSFLERASANSELRMTLARPLKVFPKFSRSTS